MTICKEQFISALREAVSAEFENIPKSENAIEFSFSNAFNKKMQRLIKSQKSSYWNLIKTVPKRVAIVCIAVAAMLFAWTPMGSAVVLGVQGRYFLPVLFLFIMLFRNTNVCMKHDIRTRIAYISMFICLFALAIIFVGLI